MEEIYKLVDEVKRRHNSPKSADTVWVIDGKERVGKSTLALHIIDKFHPECKISQVCFTLNEFIKCIFRSKEGGILVFDEAGDGMFSRDWNKEENKDIVRLFFVIGAKRFFTLLVLPNFFYLDKVFREHRVKALLHVYKTGRVRVYDTVGVRKVINSGLNYIDPKIEYIHDVYDKYEGHLKKRYDQKKKIKVNDAIRELYEKYCVKRVKDKSGDLVTKQGKTDGRSGRWDRWRAARQTKIAESEKDSVSV